jgi:hypothetical protein
MILTRISKSQCTHTHLQSNITIESYFFFVENGYQVMQLLLIFLFHNCHFFLFPFYEEYVLKTGTESCSFCSYFLFPIDICFLILLYREYSFESTNRYQIMQLLLIFSQPQLPQFISKKKKEKCQWGKEEISRTRKHTQTHRRPCSQAHTLPHTTHSLPLIHRHM